MLLPLSENSCKRNVGLFAYIAVFEMLCRCFELQCIKDVVDNASKVRTRRKETASKNSDVARTDRRQLARC